MTLKQEKLELIKAWEFNKLGELLNETQGNVQKSAKIAGVDRNNFLRLLRKHKIDANDYRVKKILKVKRDKNGCMTNFKWDEIE